MEHTKVLECGEILCVPKIDTVILLHQNKQGSGMLQRLSKRRNVAFLETLGWLELRTNEDWMSRVGRL